jgi:hypothetical protein
MRSEHGHSIRRRSVLGLAALSVPALLGVSLGATAALPKPYKITVHRDQNCGCCGVWTKLMEASGHFKPTLKDEANMPALKRRLGVPEDLSSCHTAQVEGLLVEGHVPATDILRLLGSRPANILGLAVAGRGWSSQAADAKLSTFLALTRRGLDRSSRVTPRSEWRPDQLIRIKT